MDATLQAEYGLGLGDVIAGRVSMRRLRGLVASLPLDGTALWRAQRREYRPGDGGVAREPSPEWWTPERDLIASLLDALHMRMWQAGGGKGEKPRPIMRPGHEDGRAALGTVSLTPEAFAAMWSGAGDDGADERDAGPRGEEADEDAGDS